MHGYGYFLLHNPVNATVFNLTVHLKSTVLVPENNKKGLMHMDMNWFVFFIVSSVTFIWNIIWIDVVLWAFGTEFMWICQK